jgi:hypothetical protein
MLHAGGPARAAAAAGPGEPPQPRDAAYLGGRPSGGRMGAMCL